MTYQRMGLAALVVSALRAVVADPAVQERQDEQQTQIDSVRAGFDTINSRLESLSATVASNGTLDADQAADLDGIKAELADLANALTGPAGDTTDNGVIAEVEPIDPDGDTSAAADAIVQAAPEQPAGELQQDQEQQEEQQQ